MTDVVQESNAAQRRELGSTLNERNWRRWAIVMLALLGWWLSFDLLRIGGGVSASNPLLQALCSAGSDTGCASILQSRWGRIPLSQQPGAMSLPLSLFGMAYFSLVGLWFFLVNGPLRGARLAHLGITLLIAIGAYLSGTLVYVMASIIERWCIGCATVHIVNGLITLLALSLFIWPARGAVGKGEILPRALGAALAGIFAALFQFAYILLLQNSMQVGAMNEAYVKIIRDPEFAAWQLARQPVTELPIDEKRAVGPADAPNLVQVFADPQCPVCRDLATRLNEVETKWPGRLRVIYHHFPLDRACNPSLPRSVHASSCAAALRIAAAGVVEGVQAEQRVRSAMYARQNELGVAPWAEFALTAKLDPATVEHASAGDEAARMIREDIDLAGRAGVSAVPVMFLNGKRFDAWREIPVEAWDRLLKPGK